MKYIALILVKNTASLCIFILHNQSMSTLNAVLDMIQPQSLPLGVSDSPQCKVCFEKGKAALRNYHGQLGVLLTAYDCFKQSSESYSYMGMALLLGVASYTQQGYDRTGLSQAVGWLDRAKALPHDGLQLGLIEAQLRACFDQFEKAHRILDRLPECLEVKMLRHNLLTQELREVEAKGLFLELVKTVQPEQQQDLTISMAWVYLKLNDFTKGLELLRQNLEKNPQDPWLNHTLSLFYFQLGDLKKTKIHNDKTLKSEQFPVALALQRELHKIQTLALKQVLFRTGLSALIVTLGLRIVASIAIG